MPRNRKVVEFNPSTHAYYIDGKRFSSVTALAKKMQNGYALEQYGKRQVAIGLAQRPDLIHVVASHHGDTGADARNKINDVCEQAYEAAKAGAAANTGTAIHTVLERIDKGEEFVPFDAAMAQIQIDYRVALDKAGLEAIPGLVERIVVFPKLGLAGTFDRGYRSKYVAGLHDYLDLGDVKSGLNAISYPHSMAAQLGLYSLAPCLYDPDKDELVDPPEWHGLVIAHTPITGGVELWSMDLDLCREVAEHALWLHQWMRRGGPEIIRQWIVPASSPVPLGVTASSASAAPVTAAVASTSPTLGEDKPTPAQQTTQPADPFDGLVDGYVANPASLERREWVIDRLRVLAGINGALDKVGRLWPDGLATLKQSDRHTDADLDKIIDVICAVEAIVGATWETPDPNRPKQESRWTTSTTTTATTNDNSTTDVSTSTAAETSSTSPDSSIDTPSPAASTSTPTSTTTSSSTPDEGPAADPDAVTALKAAYTALDPEQRAWIYGIAHNAQKAGRTIHLGDNPSVRRFELVTGLVTLAAGGCDDDDVVRGLVFSVDGIDYPPITPPGRTLSILDADEAAQFAHYARQLVDGTLGMCVDADDGTLTFNGVA